MQEHLLLAHLNSDNIQLLISYCIHSYNCVLCSPTWLMSVHSTTHNYNYLVMSLVKSHVSPYKTLFGDLSGAPSSYKTTNTLQTNGPKQCLIGLCSYVRLSTRESVTYYYAGAYVAVFAHAHDQWAVVHSYHKLSTMLPNADTRIQQKAQNPSSHLSALLLYLEKIKCVILLAPLIRCTFPGIVINT